MKIPFLEFYICAHLIKIIKSSEGVNSVPETDGHGTRLSDMDRRFVWTSDSDTDKVVNSDTSTETSTDTGTETSTETSTDTSMNTGTETNMFYNDINFENLSNLGHDIVNFGDHNMTVSFN